MTWYIYIYIYNIIYIYIYITYAMANIAYQQEWLLLWGSRVWRRLRSSSGLLPRKQGVAERIVFLVTCVGVNFHIFSPNIAHVWCGNIWKLVLICPALPSNDGVKHFEPLIISSWLGVRTVWDNCKRGFWCSCMQPPRGEKHPHLMTMANQRNVPKQLGRPATLWWFRVSDSVRLARSIPIWWFPKIGVPLNHPF